MSRQEQPTVCVTCQSELEPGKEIAYFAQGPLCPTKDDLGLSDDMVLMLHHMKALFDVLGNSNESEFDEDTRKELANLGRDVAKQAISRFELYHDAVRALDQRKRELEQIVSKKVT